MRLRLQLLFISLIFVIGHSAGQSSNAQIYEYLSKSLQSLLSNDSIKAGFTESEYYFFEKDSALLLKCLDFYQRKRFDSIPKYAMKIQLTKFREFKETKILMLIAAYSFKQNDKKVLEYYKKYHLSLEAPASGYFNYFLQENGYKAKELDKNMKGNKKIKTSGDFPRFCLGSITVSIISTIFLTYLAF